MIITLLALGMVSYLFTVASKRVKVPTVIAWIVAGLLLGLPHVEDFLIAPNTEVVYILGDVGLIVLMFLAGLESSWRLMLKEKKDAACIAVCSALVPFAAGFAGMVLFGFSVGVAAITGICMSITAEATKAKVLLDLDRIKTKVGSAMIGAGIIDDILGLSIFVMITVFLREASLHEDILIVAVILAFFAGIVTNRFVDKRRRKVKVTESVSHLFIVPFFFISMGLHFDFASLVLSPHVLLVIIFVGIAGKLGGAFLTRPMTGFTWRQLFIVGWGMNSRGAVGLALALIAFRTEIIPVDVYSSLVVMALISTLIFPFIITSMVKKDPRVMG